MNRKDRVALAAYHKNKKLTWSNLKVYVKVYVF